MADLSGLLEDVEGLVARAQAKSGAEALPEQFKAHVVGVVREVLDPIVQQVEGAFRGHTAAVGALVARLDRLEAALQGNAPGTGVAITGSVETSGTLPAVARDAGAEAPAATAA